VTGIYETLRRDTDDDDEVDIIDVAADVCVRRTGNK
jgi:hypothetical protein